ncbi:hypothetical protein FHR81_000660 [Actinoalloteichus hoggarensis]|uniref:Uncharacterized protein n=1 Tax=Actinoalloteichus hoggarensis TaxID=1470176 RepID=A0A221W1K5_9PSEU|nr:hypothetical protein AHOG_10095 [Actinoalloteichus hoggarensis]MBB5919631.1 hypothetical protein [Actinoalloteichus hoggarensis]
MNAGPYGADVVGGDRPGRQTMPPPCIRASLVSLLSGT